MWERLEASWGRASRNTKIGFVAGVLAVGALAYALDVVGLVASSLVCVVVVHWVRRDRAIRKGRAWAGRRQHLYQLGISIVISAVAAIAMAALILGALLSASNTY